MLGYVDDVLIVPAGILLAVKLVPPDVMAELRAKKVHKCGAVTQECHESAGSSRSHVERGLGWDRNNAR